LLLGPAQKNNQKRSLPVIAKIIGISGSPLKGMSNSFFLSECLQATEDTQGIQTELIKLAT